MTEISKPLYIQLTPNFERVRKYVYKSYTDDEYASAIQEFKRQGCTLDVRFSEMADGILVNAFEAIFSRYGLTNHLDDLAFIILERDAYLFIQTEYREINKQASHINELNHLNRFFGEADAETLTISFHGTTSTKAPETNVRTKPLHQLSKDSVVNSWIKHLFLQAINQNQYPPALKEFSHTFPVIIKGDPMTLQTVTEIGVNNTKDDDFGRDCILNIFVPTFNYLDSETKLNRGKNARWHYKQLYFITEILILLRYMKSTNPDYIPGTTKPTTEDKNKLKWIVDNALRDAIKLKSASDH